MSNVTDLTPYADRDAFTTQLNDGLRVRKTDSGYVVERLKSDLTWEALDVSGGAVAWGNITGTLTDQGNVDTDDTLAADSDAKLATQKAVKAYVDASAGGGSSNTSVIDLGIISSEDVAAGLYLELLPYVAGRLIQRIFFTVDGWEPFTNSSFGVKLATPNTVYAGLARLGNEDLNDIVDSVGLQISGGAMGFQLDDGDGLSYSCDKNQIRDVGPLVAFIYTNSFQNQPIYEWQPNTAYGLGQVVFNSAGKHLHDVKFGGVSGSTEPTWVEDGNDTTDGTITWFDSGLFDGAIHAYAEVVDMGSDDIPRPTSLEWIQQPTDAVAEVAISPAIQVRILDQNSNPYLLFNGGLNISVLGAATLGGTAFQDVSNATGIATWSDITITEPGNDYRLLVQAVEFFVPAITSDPFDVTAP